MSTKLIRNSTFWYFTIIVLSILSSLNIHGQEIESITPDFGDIGDTVNITVVGNQTNFTQQEGIIDMYIESELVLIFASAINTINDTLAIGQFILDTEDCGNVDFVMETALDGFLVIPSGFRILCDRDKDSLALVDLYNECNGTNWSNNTNWLTGPLHTWHGVGAGSQTTSRVTTLDLRGNFVEKFGLTGSLPSSFSNLTELFQLSLDYNDLDSVELSNMPALIDFACNFNNLSFLNITDMSSLMGINVIDNQLTSSGFQINNLPLLNTLGVSQNFLTTIDLTSFTNLKSIIIDNIGHLLTFAVCWRSLSASTISYNNFCFLYYEIISLIVRKQYS
ncbi:MAG: hypothetical protein R2730_06790 [Chitinophagales bacterium]